MPQAQERLRSVNMTGPPLSADCGNSTFRLCLHNGAMPQVDPPRPPARMKGHPAGVGSPPASSPWVWRNLGETNREETGLCSGQPGGLQPGRWESRGCPPGPAPGQAERPMSVPVAS